MTRSTMSGSKTAVTDRTELRERCSACEAVALRSPRLSYLDLKFMYIAPDLIKDGHWALASETLWWMDRGQERTNERACSTKIGYPGLCCCSNDSLTQ